MDPAERNPDAGVYALGSVGRAQTLISPKNGRAVDPAERNPDAGVYALGSVGRAQNLI